MAKKEQLHPFFKEISGDLSTPVSVYLKLNKPNSFLLESVTGGEQVARYSFIGFDPFCTFINQNGINHIELNGKKYKNTHNPIDELKSIVDRYDIASNPNLPTFIGGAVGFFSWEVINYIEKLHVGKKGKATYPLAHFMFPQSMIIFDHAKLKIIILHLAKPQESRQAKERIKAIEAILKENIQAEPLDIEKLIAKKDPYKFVRSNVTKAQFERAVERAKRYIYDGDVFQLVLSQKFKLPSSNAPFDVYRALRFINPSPYMFYFNMNAYQIIGSSPEILVKLENRRALLRPLAGTRPRTHENEEAVIKELRADEKECAEHIMLVDLGRNDLGRVCKTNSIYADDLMHVAKFSHVMHMVTDVHGELRPDKDAFDLFKATFPAGTLSGAPKIRSIEIIDELEPELRGPYGGALGYFDFRGNMDLCIMIRTILAQKGQYQVQSGAGLVADSIPEREYEESRNKARGMLLACL